MTTIPAFELELRKGVELAMRGQLADAAEALQRSRQLNVDALDPALNLFEVHQKLGHDSEARALEAELIRRWPNDQLALVAIARFREWNGQAAEALALLRGGQVDLREASLAYPDYLRLLIANGAFEEALLEGRRGLNSLFRPDALLAMLLGQLHFGEGGLAQETLDLLDPREYSGLLQEWGERLRRSGGAERVKPLLARTSGQLGDDSKWKALGRALSV